MGATGLEQGAAKGPVQPIEAHLKFDAPLGGTLVAATTGPESCQCIRQRYDRAIEQPHTAREPLQDWNGHRVGCQNSADSGFQNFLEASCGPRGKPLVKTLRGDPDPEGRRRLTQFL